jgi:hypothetical protein
MLRAALFCFVLTLPEHGSAKNVSGLEFSKFGAFEIHPFASLAIDFHQIGDKTLMIRVFAVAVGH